MTNESSPRRHRTAAVVTAYCKRPHLNILPGDLRQAPQLLIGAFSAWRTRRWFYPELYGSPNQYTTAAQVSAPEFYRIAGLHQLIVNGKIRVEQIAMMREERPQDGQDVLATRDHRPQSVQTPTLPRSNTSISRTSFSGCPVRIGTRGIPVPLTASAFAPSPFPHAQFPDTIHQPSVAIDQPPGAPGLQRNSPSPRRILLAKSARCSACRINCA